eukprot:1160018-Pelagomonas_calceolata.AAC.2
MSQAESSDGGDVWGEDSGEEDARGELAREQQARNKHHYNVSHMAWKIPTRRLSVAKLLLMQFPSLPYTHRQGIERAWRQERSARCSQDST